MKILRTLDDEDSSPASEDGSSCSKVGVCMGYSVYTEDYLSFCAGGKLTDVAMDIILKLFEESGNAATNCLILDTNFQVLGFGD